MVFLLQHLLSESAARYPGKEALVFKDRKMTYAELELESNRLANALVALGVERGNRIGIHMSRCIDSIVAAFGVLKAGATYVPIDPLCPKGRLAYIVDACGIKCLLASQERLEGIAQTFPKDSPLERIIVMNGTVPGSRMSGRAEVLDWQRLSGNAAAEAPEVGAIGPDLAYILFTSGSTGNPKGVMLSHLNALTFVNSAHDFFGITSDDRFSNICPLHFDMSVFDLFVAFKAGATVVVVPETSAIFPAKVAEAIAENRISVWNSVPSTLCLLATHKGLERYDLSSLRLVLFAGERFPLKYLRRLTEALPPARFCNMYGQTEANSSTYYWVDRLPDDPSASLPIGRPLPDFDVFALDADGRRITGPGEEGELYVRAATVAAGYWGDRERTEKAFVRNPLGPDLNERVYRTGDLVRLDRDGNYVFVGRKDHMIKSRGYRIEIGEIETVLCSHPGIDNAVVIPVPDELIGNRISALVVPAPSAPITREDIARYCLEHLPRYMVPESIEIRATLPTTSSGKVDRKKLSEAAADVGSAAL